MLTDTTPYLQPDYKLTAHNSQTVWIVAQNLQITRVAAHNSKIFGLAFQWHPICWLHFKITFLLIWQI